MSGAAANRSRVRRLLDPRNGPDFDLPPWPPPGSDDVGEVWAVASTPRSGSTLLCRWIWQDGGLGAPKEYLNPMQARDWALRLGGPVTRAVARPLRGPALPLARHLLHGPRLLRHVEGIRAHRTDPTGWFGLKVHAHHARSLLGARLERLPALLGDVRWVRIRREDTLNQAISWVRARQTGQWAASQRQWAPPRYSRYAIAAALRHLRRDEAWWDAVLAPHTVHHVQLSDLLAQPRRTLNGVRLALGVAPVEPLPSEPLKRQADDLTVAWRTRFLDEPGLTPPPRSPDAPAP